jgi:hypothetical protein
MLSSVPSGSRKMKRPSSLPLIAALASAFGLYHGASARAQQTQSQSEEIVANLAAGRVLIYVAREGIVIGVVDSSLEPGSRLPAIVPLGGRRVGVLLGAVDWFLPAAGRFQAQLDRALPRVISRSGPHLKQEGSNDIEQAGLALLEPLRLAAESLHSKIDLPPEESLLELLLVDYAEGYGPEVWNLRYRFRQEPLRGDFLETRVQRPGYTQLYPPEKGQPHTLVELQYPTEEKPTTLLDLIRGQDPRLVKIKSADEQMARAVENLERGTSQKAHLSEATAFVRAALGATASNVTNLAVAVLAEDRGFQWVVAPPNAPLPPNTEEAGKARPAGAPSLHKPGEPPR